MTLELLSATKPHHTLRVRPAVEAALQALQQPLVPELQTLSDLHTATSRLRAIRSWLALLTIFDVLMLRADGLSGPMAFQAGMIMRLEINLPLAVAVFLALPYVPDRARTPMFGTFNLILLMTISIQAHYAQPAFSFHHMIAGGLLIACFNVLVPETLARAARFTALALVLFLGLLAAPIGPYQPQQWDLVAIVTLIAVATLRVRYNVDVAAREAFLLRLQEGMNTQDVMFANRVLVERRPADARGQSPLLRRTAGGVLAV
jgi:hypothetical protein